jgi:hypothetical protein
MMMANGEYDMVKFGDNGDRITRRQRQIFLGAQVEIGMEFTVLQGSKEPESDWSGISHVGLGAADVWLPRMDDPLWLNYVTRVLRRRGLAAFARGPWTKMSYHWHCLDLDTHGLSGDSTMGAIWQVGQYRAAGGPYNGLKTGVPDLNPYRPSPIRKYRFKPV